MYEPTKNKFNLASKNKAIKHLNLKKFLKLLK